MTMASKFNEALLELGKVVSFDRTRLSPSTIECMLSHIRLLKRNNVPLTRDQLVGRPVETINSLRDSRGKTLSKNYKRQVLMTIKRMFPKDYVKTNAFGGSRVRATSRLMSEDYLSNVKKIIERAALVLGRAYDDETIDSLGMYDTCVAVLITSCTSLRIHEIMGMKLRHMNQIRNGVPIAIKSKGKRNLRNIAPNDLLLGVFRAIEEQRPKVLRFLRNSFDTRSIRAETIRYEAEFVVVTSVDFMRKKLRELAASLFIPRETLGFNVFRSFIVSVLVENGSYELAQSMNNHSSLNTTLDHYNVVTPRVADNTYAKLDDLMRVLTPHEQETRNRMARELKMPSSSSRLDPIAEDEEESRRPQLRSLPYDTPAWQPGDVTSK